MRGLALAGVRRDAAIEPAPLQHRLVPAAVKRLWAFPIDKPGTHELMQAAPAQVRA